MAVQPSVGTHTRLDKHQTSSDTLWDEQVPPTIIAGLLETPKLKNWALGLAWV